MMKAEEQLTWNISNKMNLIGGATYEYFTSIPKTADLDAAVDTKKQIAGVLMGTKTKYNPDGIPEDFFMFKYSNFGSYLQTQYAPNEKFILTLGARYDNNSLYGNSFNPRFGIVVKPTTKTTIKLLYGSAFLGATPYNMGQHFGSFYTEDEGKTYKSSYWWLPNPELEPLKEKTGEISINQFIGDDFSITLTGYYIALTNLYSVTGDADYKNFYNGKFKGWPVSFIQIPINEGEQTNYGGNLQLNHSYRWSSNRVNSYLSVSYVDGKIQQKAGTLDKKAEIANIVPVTVRLGTDVFIGKLSFSPRLTYFTDQSSTIFEDPKNPDKRKTIKGYTMLNIAAQYTPVKMLSLFLDVRNALNQEYRVGYGEGQLQQKIRVFGGIRINLK
jgi:iron complex outermembrane receptor protein